MEPMLCPKCGDECDRDEVDVGVGVLHGPWGCCTCGWSEHPDYDASAGPSPAQRAHPDHYVDSQGGLTPLGAIADKLDHFGLPGAAIVADVFRVPPATDGPGKKEPDDGRTDE